ncbi:MAG: TraB/GumN family protein [Candidatus Schekmanbacteria bacterium]|nr:TraB/GumN family protein [Candidatus Schekmanbacteria bacterium]
MTSFSSSPSFQPRRSRWPRGTAPLAAGLLIVALGGLLATCGLVHRNHVFWKLRSETATLYLLGSIHFASASMFPLDSVIEKAYAESDVLVVEANVLKYDQAAMQQMITFHAVATDQRRLSERLGDPDLYRRLQVACAEYNVDLELMQRMEIWFVAISLAAQAIQQLGYSPEHGIDMYFLRRAIAEKDIAEVEGMDEQMRLFDFLPRAQQLLLLDYTLRDLGSLPVELPLLISAWETGNVASIEQSVFRQLREAPPLQPIFEVVFKKRNQSMADRIRRLMLKSHTYFAVVGAGHLVGADSLLELLTRKGYQVEQL